jgi:hypothetical protein
LRAAEGTERFRFAASKVAASSFIAAAAAAAATEGRRAFTAVSAAEAARTRTPFRIRAITSLFTSIGSRITITWPAIRTILAEPFASPTCAFFLSQVLIEPFAPLVTSGILAGPSSSFPLSDPFVKPFASIAVIRPVAEGHRRPASAVAVAAIIVIAIEAASPSGAAKSRMIKSVWSPTAAMRPAAEAAAGPLTPTRTEMMSPASSAKGHATTRTESTSAPKRHSSPKPGAAAEAQSATEMKPAEQIGRTMKPAESKASPPPATARRVIIGFVIVVRVVVIVRRFAASPALAALRQIAASNASATPLAFIIVFIVSGLVFIVFAFIFLVLIIREDEILGRDGSRVHDRIARLIDRDRLFDIGPIGDRLINDENDVAEVALIQLRQRGASGERQRDAEHANRERANHP